jgi:hypothetical protein
MISVAWPSAALCCAAFMLTAGPALSQVGPSTSSMTCAQARSFVTVSGGVVLSTGPTTYDRFVAHSGYCVHGERAELAWVPTRDVAQCPLNVCRAANRWSPR